MELFSEAKKVLRTRFVSGLLVVIPLILTFVLLRALVESIDGLLGPLVTALLGHSYDFPFVGVIVTIALIVLAGIFAANVIGGRLIRLWERLLLRIPIVSFVYGSAKQLVQALSIPHSNSFKSVVMVEYPRRGVYALGFLVKQTKLAGPSGDRKMASVFIPSTPTPISGLVVIFPEEEVVYLDMTIEEGVKFFVSGGIISPERLNPRQEAGLAQSRERRQETFKVGIEDEIK